MRKTNHFFFLSLLLLMNILQGCSRSKDENNCVSNSKLEVIKAEGPHIGTVNQEISFAITYGIANGCGQFDHYEQSVSGNTTTIAVIGKYTGCVCTEIYQEMQSPYTFKAANVGIYYLEFFHDVNTVVKDTIVIQ
jgi:hypothetical protein